MGNAFDLTDYQKKDLASTIEGATTVEGALGALSTNKASKVSGATNGDFASLDANGNLVDSGASIENGGTKVLALKGNDNLHPVDLNDLTAAGVYSIISQGSSHLPNSEYLTWWQIIVITKSDTSANQGYCTQYAMARNNLVYMRDCEAGTWSSWQKLVTESDMPKTDTFIVNGGTYVPANFIIVSSSTSGLIEFEQTVHNDTSLWAEGYAYIKGIWDVAKSTIQIIEKTGNSDISAIVTTYNFQACVSISATLFPNTNGYKLTKAKGYGGAIVDYITST
jgi:hypothetical protein